MEKIVKCIACGYVGLSSDGLCGSCGDNDLHSSVIGQSATVGCLSDDTDLMEWCEENTYHIIITSVDSEAQLVWGKASHDKECPYGIHLKDLE